MSVCIHCACKCVIGRLCLATLYDHSFEYQARTSKLTLSFCIQETDGGIITKPKTVASASSNVTKSTSALPPATKNTSNKNEEIKIRDNKMKKTGSASTIIPDPKKRLMVEEKGKVHIPTLGLRLFVGINFSRFQK